jgi:acetolactate synthase small subunit
MKREDDARLGIEAAIARRKDEFALSHLAWTGNGYTVKFRQGIVDIVRTAVDGRVFEDPSRLDALLDAVRLAVQSLNPARSTHTGQ